MIVDLNTVFDQFRAWNKSQRKIRYTDGESWVLKSLKVGIDSIVFEREGDQLGSSQTLELRDADFEIRDNAIIASWKSGKAVQFQEENPLPLRCQCTGESCGHHSPEQPCMNEAVPPTAFVLDLATNQPVPSSERAVCLACHAANTETAGDMKAP
jgi:hypothetical protein